MLKKSFSVAAVAALIGLGACGGGQDEQGVTEEDNVRTTPISTDAPPAAISDPASPPPIGTDVGAVGADATAAPATADTAAHTGAHP